jgi:hypothetical protein
MYCQISFTTEGQFLCPLRVASMCLHVTDLLLANVCCKEHLSKACTNPAYKQVQKAFYGQMLVTDRVT